MCQEVFGLSRAGGSTRVCKVVRAAYDLVVRRADVVMVEVGVDERCLGQSVDQFDTRVRVPSTCSLCRLDKRELGTLGLDLRPVEVAALPVGDITTLGVCALHELALTVGSGCAGYAERQRQSSEDNVVEERSHVERCWGNTRQLPRYLCKIRPTIQGAYICKTWP